MIDRGLVRARPDTLVDLPGDQPLEGDSLQPDRLGPEVGEDLAGLREEEVTAENGDGVVPPRIGRRRPAPHRRLVHHVVVVESGLVGELDDRGGGDDPRRVRIPELGRHECEQRPHALAAGRHQVAGRGGDEGVPRLRRGVEQLLDGDQTRTDLLIQRRVGHRQAERSGRQLHAHFCSPLPRSATPSNLVHARLASVLWDAPRGVLITTLP